VPENRAPVSWILLASLLFATMSALVKVAAAGVSLPEVVFFRTLPAAVLLLALARIRRQRVTSAHGKLYALRILVGIASMFVGFYGLSQLPLATATTLEYTTPLFMLAYMILLARRHLTPQMAFAIVGGFVGVVVLLQPTLQTGQTLAFFASLTSGALAALTYVLIRRLAEVGEPAWRIVLWYSIAGTVVAAAMIPFARTSHYTIESILALAALGVVGLFAQLTMTRAFSSGPTTLLASLQYSTVAFAAIYGAAVFGDSLSATSVFGLSLIVLSAIVAVRADKPIQVES
jgi:S-adenosylmethionine uptake transporter